MAMYLKLSMSPVFQGLKPDEVRTLIERAGHSVRSFSRGQTIAQRDEEVKSLCVIVEGSVKGEMVDFSGKILKIEERHAPMPIAHAFLFGERNRYPVDVVALEDCKILFIPKSGFMWLMQQSSTVLGNYLAAISSRAQFLSNRLWFLSFKTIREKVAHYLLSISRGEPGAVVVLPESHRELAEFFGVTRPSLARVFADLQEEGVIAVSRRQITIASRDKLLKMVK